ncbi:hypothetical protein V7G09_04750 [Cutibacterium avidum]|jgi:hypothetical protein|uniref:hypothetical protein n=1 Tax=Cutibacterium avidum TaxID=33010 RepID=UPI00204E682D|nr:hypothetical protein [Cutibacterium avidum]MDU5809230.1 hypothetical protein [Finegoldia magna]DAL65391.1 MAG TPA_asm: hypothetical protein [Caudoviricetes sp.]MCO6684736.1 hypothetical protein [Cutibacterium avidum]MDU5841467.1 hypothetical protein [Cutibacterium avidum]MDU7429476.1 hypothetical protein [Cutibacterium avidum]
MDLTRAIDTARDWHEQLYTDKAVIFHTVDTSTDEDGVEYDDMHRSAPIDCLVQRINGEASQSTSAGDSVRIATHVCKTSPNVSIQVGDMLDVIDSYDSDNEDFYRIVDMEQQAWAITRKVYLVRAWRSRLTPHS